MDFTGKLGKYIILETEDKTKTLWSEYFDEACHNLSGAYDETIHNYISGCKITEQLSRNKEIHVLDVGFGLGIGLKAFIDTLVMHSNQLVSKNLSYTSIELDEDLYLWSMNHTFPGIKLNKMSNVYSGIIQINSTTPLLVNIFIGDGRKTLPDAFSTLPKFSAIFQDAFSPKKNPALWSVEWFTFLKIASAPEVYLSTYSSSVSIRKSLIVAGWIIENGKGFGQKRTMTKARLFGTVDPLLQAELSRSPAIELRDS